MKTDRKNTAGSTGSNTEKTLRSSIYPALTRFYKGNGHNYNPYVYCPGCGCAEPKRPLERCVYLCSRCKGEFYWSHYGRVIFIEEGYLVAIGPEEYEAEEMYDTVPPDAP